MPKATFELGWDLVPFLRLRYTNGGGGDSGLLTVECFEFLLCFLYGGLPVMPFDSGAPWEVGVSIGDGSVLFER